jgi:hypothetical protein
MYRAASLLLLCGIFVVDGANADRNIVLLSGNAEKVDINDVLGTIFITDGDASTFVFECFDDVTGNPADIEEIGLSGTPTGTITVSILAGPGHTYGAANVAVVDLTDDNVTGVIDDMTLSADLGSMDDVICDSITGTVTCQDVIHNVTIDDGSLTGSFTANDITGTITIVRGRLNGSLTANTLGDVDLQRTAPTLVHHGDITVNSATVPYSGTITSGRPFYGNMTFHYDVSGALNLSKLVGGISIDETLSGSITSLTYLHGNISAGAISGSIDIRDYIAGVITVTHNLSGQIDAAGNLQDAARIVISGDVSQTDPNVPAIHIAGGITGSGGSSPAIDVAGELDGIIAIDGGLDNTIDGPEIQVESVDLNGQVALTVCHCS